MRTALRRLNIKARMFVCIILLSLAPQLLLVTLFFQSSRDSLIRTTRDSIYRLISVNNEVLDEQLRLVRETTMNILIDDDLFEIFTVADGAASGFQTAPLGYYDNDRTESETARNVRKTLLKYFGNSDIIAQVEIATRQACYAMNAQSARYDAFWQSDPYRRIEAQGGGIVWLGKQEMAPYRIEKDYLSCARLMNLRRVSEAGIGEHLPEGCERPVLRVMFSDAFIARQIGKSIEGLSSAQYGLLGPAGETLLSGGTLQVRLDDACLRRIDEQGSGMLQMLGAAGEPVIVCFDRLRQSGWTSLAAFSVSALSGPLEGQMRAMFVGVVIVQALTSLLAALSAARLMGARIDKVSRAVDDVKAGRFTARIEDDRRDEFTRLVSNFNEMSATLRQLIDENVSVSLREQEARLQTLMAQLNPHYIYNSLNVINWVALREGDRAGSKLIVALSRMLQYTSNNHEEATRLSDDIAWMARYFLLMDARFAGLYAVTWDVQEDCRPLRLPKLFMQPLAENSILHGFGDRREGGRIGIRIWQEAGFVICRVEDNGCGMDASRADDILSGRTGCVGLYNVHRRIELVCGAGCGLSIASKPGEGTCVTARMRAQ